jgi:hypothetical protein
LASITRNIGLSLGADICWPICFEQIMKKLNLKIAWKGDTIDFHVERVTIEPFNLRQPVKYAVVVDRLTHWYNTSREWIKKAILMDGLYVFNNPWGVQSMEKHTTYAAMMALGMPIPETVMVPPKSYGDLADIKPTLKQYARLFDLGRVGKELGYPLFMKPYDGGGWKGVSRIADEQALRKAYEESGTLVMHLQKAIEPYDRFVRTIGFGPQTMQVLYDPAAPLHDRYTRQKDFLQGTDKQVLDDTTLTINAFFGWDFNSCEALRKDGVWYPIDFANPCPDSQVTSLHYHFPWLVKAYLKWTIYCATTQRKMRRDFSWEPYYEIAAKKDLPYAEKLKAYGKLSRERLDADKFEDFCKTHLKNFDEVCWEFFGTEIAKDAIRKKVAALYPPHEVEQFTELFFNRVQQWRSDNKK